MQEAIFYVHVPFCSSKCHFCSWVSPIPTSELVRAKSRFGAYAAAVIEEIRNTAAQTRHRPVRPKLVYFGGGTPSLLSGADLGAILEEIFLHFPKGPEFLDTTIEMSPDTATDEKLRTLRAAGFNRISFGVQSFNERRARSIGRAHSPLTAIQAFELARRAGFENINVDLMIGFPEETEEEWRDSLQTALMLEPDHVSVYIYKKIPGTVMAKLLDTNKLKPCPQATAIARYNEASEILAQAGYAEYMFQLFHKEDKRCFVDYHYFHLNYDYLGFGQGAHTLAGGKSYAHSQTLAEYLKRPGHNQSVRAMDSEALLETKFFETMHTDEGLNYHKFSSRLKIPFEEALAKSLKLRRAVDSCLETNFVEKTATGLRFTEREARVKWLSLPPYWDERYTPRTADQALYSISQSA